MDLSALAGFVEKFQTLIAGTIAIIAAGIAYLGSLRQARAVLEAESQRAAEHRRAVAGALWAELASIGRRLFADSQRLLSTKVRDGRMLELTQLDLSVFNANLPSIGRLPPDDAFMVTNIYKIIIDINQRYANISASSGIDDQVANSMGQYLGAILEQIRVTLRGTRSTAGMPEDRAAAAMAPWTPVVR